MLKTQDANRSDEDISENKTMIEEQNQGNPSFLKFTLPCAGARLELWGLKLARNP